MKRFFVYKDDKQSGKNIIKEGAGAMLETIPEILTLIQCQELLHIGRTTILNMIKQEELKAFKVRGRWRIRKADLEEYLAKQTEFEWIVENKNSLVLVPSCFKLMNLSIKNHFYVYRLCFENSNIRLSRED